MADITTDTGQDQEAQPLSSEARATCPHCGEVGEFDLPAPEGLFAIACFSCEEVYEIDGAKAVADAIAAREAEALAQENALLEAEQADDTLIIDEFAASDDNDASDENFITCVDCGGQIDISNLDSLDDGIMPECPNCTSTPSFARQPRPESSGGKAGIIMVSIMSLALVLAAGLVAAGLYVVTLKGDSDAARFIETNILQVKPASFTIDSAAYEVSESDLGTSLLVTINVTNDGGSEGAPNAMLVMLTDAAGNTLVSWPLDASGQIVTPGQTVQLYTRLFEPPEGFANIKVAMR